MQSSERKSLPGNIVRVSAGIKRRTTAIKNWKVIQYQKTHITSSNLQYLHLI